MFGVLAQEGGPLKVVFDSFENTALWVILGISLVALVFAYFLVREVLAAPEGTDKMKEIAKAIQEGAKAYLSRQFRTVAVFVVVIGVVLFFVLPVPEDAIHSEFSIRFGRSIAFILGAVFSAITGYVGMWLAVRANVRTANAARESGLRQAVKIAFRAGGVAGMFTVGLGLFGATAILLIYKQDATSVLVGLRLRRRAARDVHAGGRRHLHEGGRRRRRPGGQGRAGHPRGRPAQRRDDRRQRRRQRRRLRRDGGRPVRVRTRSRWSPR